MYLPFHYVCNMPLQNISTCVHLFWSNHSAQGSPCYRLRKVQGFRRFSNHSESSYITSIRYLESAQSCLNTSDWGTSGGKDLIKEDEAVVINAFCGGSCFDVGYHLHQWLLSGWLVNGKKLSLISNVTWNSGLWVTLHRSAWGCYYCLPSSDLQNDDDVHWKRWSLWVVWPQVQLASRRGMDGFCLLYVVMNCQTWPEYFCSSASRWHKSPVTLERRRHNSVTSDHFMNVDWVGEHFKKLSAHTSGLGARVPSYLQFPFQRTSGLSSCQAPLRSPDPHSRDDFLWRVTSTIWGLLLIERSLPLTWCHASSEGFFFIGSWQAVCWGFLTLAHLSRWIGSACPLKVNQGSCSISRKRKSAHDVNAALCELHQWIFTISSQLYCVISRSFLAWIMSLCDCFTWAFLFAGNHDSPRSFCTFGQLSSGQSRQKWCHWSCPAKPGVHKDTLAACNNSLIPFERTGVIRRWWLFLQMSRSMDHSQGPNAFPEVWAHHNPPSGFSGD